MHDEMRKQASNMLLGMSLTAAMIHALISQSELEIDEWFAENMVCKCGKCDMEASQPIIEIYREMIVLQEKEVEPRYSQYLRWIATIVEVMEDQQEEEENVQERIMRAAKKWGTDPCNN